MSEATKQQVQRQFGANAAAYATSAVHAKGASLARLVELVGPQPHWRVLDVATAAGHTAFAFAPHVTRVVATDLTPKMLGVAANLAGEKGIANVELATADAETLPFANNSFHLVTCRMAPHHFPHVDRFLGEAARVLKPEGVLAVVDNVVPGSRRRGKKAERLRRAGDYVNAFEALRDPGHHRCLSLDAWVDGFVGVGFVVMERETAEKWLDFNAWAARMQVSADNRTRLRAMLLQAPEPVLSFLTPQTAGDTIKFRLEEAIIIGKLED